MTTRQWLALLIGLWACYFVIRLTLDGVPRIVAGACVFLGFAWSSVERFRNWRNVRARNRM